MPARKNLALIFKESLDADVNPALQCFALYESHNPCREDRGESGRARMQSERDREEERGRQREEERECLAANA